LYSICAVLDKKMRLELDPDDQDQINVGEATCPDDGDTLTFWHDMKCAKCDHSTKLYCPTCMRHWRIVD
jgi:uncharacterized protein YbaR (Trm112 family)